MVDTLACGAQWRVVEWGWGFGSATGSDKDKVLTNARNAANQDAMMQAQSYLKDYDCTPPCTLRWAVTLSDPVDGTGYDPVKLFDNPLHSHQTHISVPDFFAAFGFIVWTLEVACLQAVELPTPGHFAPRPRPRD